MVWPIGITLHHAPSSKWMHFGLSCNKVRTRSWHQIKGAWSGQDCSRSSFLSMFIVSIWLASKCNFPPLNCIHHNSDTWRALQKRSSCSVADDAPALHCSRHARGYHNMALHWAWATHSRVPSNSGSTWTGAFLHFVPTEKRLLQPW